MTPYVALIRRRETSEDPGALAMDRPEKGSVKT